MEQPTALVWKSIPLVIVFLLAVLAGCGGGIDVDPGTSPSLQSIAVTPANPSVPAGLTQQFTATGTYSDGTSKDITAAVTWTSSTTSVATIAARGLATAIGAGSALITAIKGSVSASTTLTVTAVTLQSIAVTPDNPSIPMDLAQQFTATGTYSNGISQDITSSVTWTSGTISVATISASGLASGIGAGSTIITATLGSTSGGTTLTVTAATLQAIAVTPTNPSVPAGLTQQFTATSTYSDGTSPDITAFVTWASDTTSVATIATSGLASGVGVGAALISATLGATSGSTTLSVTAATLQSIAVTPANPTVTVGSTQQFTAMGTYSDGTSQDISASVTWTSDTTTVATVMGSGLASAIATGLSEITATLGSIFSSTTITVIASTSYAISGTVSGLSGSGLTLQNNGGDNLAVSTNGSFTFATTLLDSSGYQVTVAVQPASPDQFCNVFNSSGTIAGADVTDVMVVCTGVHYNIVDTNQSTCFDSGTGNTASCNGSGYDADYQGNQPSYTQSSDGKVVTDNVTGLIWSQSSDLNGDGLVEDNDKLSQADGQTYCSNLTLDGYDWRLPSIKELYSLIEFSGKDASTYTGTDTSTLTPFIDHTFDWAFGDQSVGDRIIDGQYATSTNYVWTTMGGNATMFGVNFVDGRIKGYPSQLTKRFYVRCVTGNTSYGVNDLVDNLDATISDLATGLMWEQNDHAPVNFETAVATCEAATTASHNDWRLPNAKELQSLVDYSRSPDTTNSSAIDPLFNATSFINEGGLTDWGYYWASTTHITNEGNGSNATYVCFGRCLGYFNVGAGMQILDVHGAGSQRSDNKISAASVPNVLIGNVGNGNFYYHGPQGDIQRSTNMVRCVR